MSEAPRILVVEDEPQIAGILVDYLARAGYAARGVGDGHAALAASAEADLMLLDLMLPGLDGVAVCRAVRAKSDLPIIMVTARVEEIDRLLGLQVGADDYICKPFSPREVVARVAAVLRRARGIGAPDTASARFAIDEAAQRITVGGRRLDLTPTEYRLLRLLVSRPGRVFSRAQIIELAYDNDQDVSDRAVDSHVKNIRRKVAELLEGEAIQSVYGIGYLFDHKWQKQE